MRNDIHRKNNIHRELPNPPGRRQPVGVPSGRPSGHGVRRRPAGSIDPRVGVVIAALAAVAALFIPWLTLDAHAGSLSGIGLMSYALQGNDRIVMWQISPVATALLLSVPFGIAAGVIYTAWNVLRGRYRADAPLMTFAAVLALLRFTPPVLDGSMHTLGAFAAPGPGLGILLAATLVVIAITLSSALRQRRVVAPPQRRGL